MWDDTTRGCLLFITLLIKINGEGTKYLSQLKEGSELKALLPLGNGLDLDNFEEYQAEVRKAFQSILPIKSKFEKNGASIDV